MRRYLLIGTLLAMTLSASPANAALVSYWAGDGNAHDSVGANSGTLVGGATFAPGLFGQAFKFDGTSYFQAPTIGLPTGNHDRTLDLWFNVNAYSDTAEEAFLAGYGAFGSLGQAYEILVVHFNPGIPPIDKVAFSQWGNGFVGGRAIQTGTWHNLGVTNSTGFVTLYLDGTAEVTETLSIDTPSNTNFYIGRIPGALGKIRQLEGLVDEVRVYDTALSASEMKALAMIPEPGTGLLVMTGLLGLAASRRRRVSR